MNTIQLKCVWSDGSFDSFEETFETESDSLIDGVCEFLKNMRSFSDEDVESFKLEINKGWQMGYEWKFDGTVLYLNGCELEEWFYFI